MIKYILNYSILAAFFLCGSPVLAQNEPDADAAALTQPAPASIGFAGSYLSSQYAKINGDLDGAILYLQRVYKNNPDNADVAAQLEAMLLMDGQVDKARAIAVTGKTDDSDSVALLVLTLGDVKRGDMEAAAKRLDNAFESGGGQLWLPLISAWVDASRKPLTKPLALESLSGNVGRAGAIMNYHLALINDHAGFEAAAAQNYVDAIENPKNPPLRVMHSLLKFYDENGKPELLRPVVEAFREAHPDDGQAMQPAVIASPQDGIAEVLFTMGNVMHSAGVAQDAAMYLQLALFLKPDLNVAAMSLADAYSELKLYEKANALYVTIPQGNSQYVRAQLKRAMNLDRLGRLSEALKALDAMSKQAEHRNEALVARADLLRLHQRYGEAVDAYSQALKLIGTPQQQHWPILFARGSCYELLGKWTLAEADLQRALELKPNQPDVLNYLGFSWLTRGVRLDEAHDMIARAVAMRPNDPQIVDSMAWALFLLGDYDAATEYAEKAVELLPSDPTVNDHLGDIYWRQDRKNEARFQWERALSYSPDAALAAALHKKLKDGLPASGMAAHKAPVVAADQTDDSLVR